MLLGVGAVATKTYVDDIFSSYLWAGSGSAKTITNGVDLSDKGGVAWIKSRSNTADHWLFDTLNGDEWGYNSNTKIKDSVTQLMHDFTACLIMVTLLSRGFRRVWEWFSEFVKLDYA